MKITFQNQQIPDNYLTEKGLSAYYLKGGENAIGLSKGQSLLALSKGIRVDLTGTSRSILVNEGKNAADIASMAENTLEGLQNQQDFMTVMSGCVSDEDFGKMLQEGADPAEMDLSETTTILDRIKLEMIKGGADIAGYTDDISKEKLAKMTGSQAFAENLVNEFKKADIPLSQDILIQSAAAYGEAVELPSGPLSDNTIASLLSEGLPPTIENIYIARHSGSRSSGQETYYRDQNGYVTKGGDGSDFSGMEKQIEKIIKEAGFEVSVETKENAGFLLKQDIPLTPENLQTLSQLRQMRIPEAGAREQNSDGFDGSTLESAVAKSIAAAVSQGKMPGAAVLGVSENVYEKAIRINEEFQRIDPERFAENPAEYGFDTKRLPTPDQIDAKLALVNVQLKMTTEANLLLLRSGYEIETAPLTQLAGQLSQARAVLYPGLTDAQIGQYEQTNAILRESASWPAAIAGQLVQEADAAAEPQISSVQADASGITPASSNAASGDNTAERLSPNATLTDISTRSAWMAARYREAGEAYEMLRMEPDEELGDALSKAYQNADGLLSGMGYEATEDNRRALRILGYNQMAITSENLELVRAADARLRGVLQDLSPVRVLNMIRNGINPLTQSLDSLEELLAEGGSSEQRDSSGNETENRLSSAQKDMNEFTRFLQGLERKKEITQEERQGYMGMYRFLNRLNEDDGKAIGYLVHSRADISFGNLLAAMRTGLHTGMDYRVDDSFAGVELKTGIKAIDEQVEKAIEAIILKRNQDAVAARANGRDEKVLNAKAAYQNALAKEAGEKFTAQMPPEFLPEADTTLERFVDNLRKNDEENVFAGKRGRENDNAAAEPNVAEEKEYVQNLSQRVRDSAAYNQNLQGDPASELRSIGLPASPELLEGHRLLESGEFFKTLKKYAKNAEIKNTGTENSQSRSSDALQVFGKGDSLQWDLEALNNPEDAGKEAMSFADKASQRILNAGDSLENADSSVFEEIGTLMGALRISVKRAFNEDYEIPLETEGGVSAIRVRFLHGQEQGSIQIKASSEELDEVSASFFLSESLELTGQIQCSRRDVLPRLSSGIQDWARKMGALGVSMKEIGMGYARHPGEILSPSVMENPTADSAILYQAAKTFLQSIFE
ncbi:MAG: hypothetical protein IJU50_06645 [Lachnospiraceae bacterium]|nr:hypothetical protein [Lachnospiraceae bacterium]